MAASRHIAQHRHAPPKHLRIARQHLASIKVYFFRNAVSHIAVVTGSPVFSQSLPILRHLSSANICKISSCLSVKFIGPLIGPFIGPLTGSRTGSRTGPFYTMGVAHKSLFHSRLAISRVTVSTTLKTPNSLTFCQLRSTTITRDLAEPNKSMDEGNHERLSGGSCKRIRDCHKTAAAGRGHA